MRKLSILLLSLLFISCQNYLEPVKNEKEMLLSECSSQIETWRQDCSEYLKQLETFEDDESKQLAKDIEHFLSDVSLFASTIIEYRNNYDYASCNTHMLLISFKEKLNQTFEEITEMFFHRKHINNG